MIALVNYAKELHSVELREFPIPKIGEDVGPTVGSVSWNLWQRRTSVFG